MVKTNDALEILRRHREKDPELQRYYEEEKLNLKIAILVRESREAEGLTQAKLAKLIGTKKSVIDDLEEADFDGNPLYYLQQIAKALKKSLVIDLKDIKQKKQKKAA